MIYSVWEWKARKGDKKASRFREALQDRVRFLPLPLGEVSPQVTERASPLEKPLSRLRRHCPSCGSQHPLHFVCVLLAAAPTASPCICHWQRSSLLPYKGEARRQMRVLDFCGRSAYNEITKEDRVPNFWTHEQTESPLGTANTEGASCLPGVSVCRA